MKDNIFLILGGDDRSLYLGEYLEKQGFKVCYYAFNQTDCYKTLTEAVNEANCIILPLPLTRDRTTLNTPLFDETVLLSDICALAIPDKLFLGGKIPTSCCEEIRSRGAECYDYMKLDELALYNAVPTAEGVLQILIEKTPITIHGMKCAITGYGKVGKVLASTLKALGADVTVFARKELDFACAYTQSIKAEGYSTLKEGLNDFDALINTVPVKVIDRDVMLHLNPDCLLIETASAPFGIDFQAAKELAFEVVKAGSLPGKVAPRTAGEIIGRSVLPIIKTRGLFD